VGCGASSVGSWPKGIITRWRSSCFPGSTTFFGLIVSISVVVFDLVGYKCSNKKKSTVLIVSNPEVSVRVASNG
jgi:hypothetical protein